VLFKIDYSRYNFNILALLEGEGDDYPEGAFWMKGNLEEALEEGRNLAREAEEKKH
jgi:hypothetical protein